jgi:hypothetical protein
LLLLSLSSLFKKCDIEKKRGEILFDKKLGEILQNIAPVIPCDATVTMMQTMGKGSQNEI